MSEQLERRIQSKHPMHMVMLADNSQSMSGEAARALTDAIRNWILRLQKKISVLFCHLWFVRGRPG